MYELHQKQPKSQVVFPERQSVLEKSHSARKVEKLMYPNQAGLTCEQHLSPPILVFSQNNQAQPRHDEILH